MVKQSMDTTFGDICKCELLTELGLRVIEVQSSAPVMWIIPSQRIHQGFPVTISHDLHPATASSVSLPMRTPPPHRIVETFTSHRMCHDLTCIASSKNDLLWSLDSTLVVLVEDGARWYIVLGFRWRFPPSDHPRFYSNSPHNVLPASTNNFFHSANE